MAQAMVSQEPSMGWRWIALPCWVFGAAMLVKVGGGDIWWHVRTGQWIVVHGAIPTTDPFSHTAPGPWHYSEALAQLLYYGAYAAARVPGLQLLHAACGVVLAALVAQRGKQDGVGPMSLALGLAGAASFAATAIKPQIFTYIGFAAVLLLLHHAERSRPRLLYALPPLFLLWANLHRGGMVGLAALAAAAVAWSLDRRKRGLLRPLAVGSVLSALALLGSSGGGYYYSSTFDLTLGGRLVGAIGEWQPLSLDGVLHHHMALLLLVPLAAYGLARRSRSWLELLVALGVALMAVRVTRFVPLLAIALAPSAAAGVAGLLKHAGAAIRPTVQRFALVAMGVATMASFYLYRIPEGYQGFGIMDGRVPVEAAAFMSASPPPGELWNSFDLGGYLLFALAPAQRVFIDGRNDTVYPRPFFEQSLRAPSDPRRLRYQLMRYGVNTAVVANGDQLPGRLAPILDDPAWCLVYWDDVAAVMVQRSVESEPYLARFGYRALSPRTGMRRASAIATDPERDLLAADILANVQRAPGSMRAQWLAAMLFRARGDRIDFEHARRALAQIAAERGMAPPRL